MARRSYRLSVDAAYDLRDSGYCDCGACIEAFISGFRAAADAIANERDIDIEVVRCTDRGALASWVSDADDDDEAERFVDEGKLWLECYEMALWDDESSPKRCETSR